MRVMRVHVYANKNSRPYVPGFKAGKLSAWPGALQERCQRTAGISVENTEADFIFDTAKQWRDIAAGRLSDQTVRAMNNELSYGNRSDTQHEKE